MILVPIFAKIDTIDSKTDMLGDERPNKEEEVDEGNKVERTGLHGVKIEVNKTQMKIKQKNVTQSGNGNMFV